MGARGLSGTWGKVTFGLRARSIVLSLEQAGSSDLTAKRGAREGAERKRIGVPFGAWIMCD